MHDPDKCGCEYRGDDMWSCGHIDNAGDIDRPWNVIGPDELEIAPIGFASAIEAHAGALEWVKRYERQGYYKTGTGERIPFNLILRHCQLVNEVTGENYAYDK